MVRMLGISMGMMPVATAGINRLALKLIPHGTAMNDTMRQVGGSIGTAVLVTVMANNITMTANGDPTPAGAIEGVNAAFMFATILALIGIIRAFFVKGTKMGDNKEIVAKKQAN